MVKPIRFRRRRRPGFHPDRDQRAGDGHFYAGWRLVRAGGWVKAGDVWYQDESLLPFAGKKIWIAMADYWKQEAIVYAIRWDMRIGTIQAVHRPKSQRKGDQQC
jgi:hypothetical protein